MGLFITLVLGLFIIVGAIITFASKNNDRFVDFSISLAFSVMIMLILVDLIPEVKGIFTSHFGIGKGIILAALSILLGIALLKILDIFIPDHDGKKKEELNHIGLISSIALVLHNIIEGMAVYNAVNSSFKTGLLISIGVGLHNIPLGMVISSTFYKASNNKKKAWTVIILVSLSTFIGGFITMLLGGVITSDIVEGSLLGVTLGMLIYISIFELLPKICEMKNKKNAIWGISLGIVLILLTLLI